MALDNFGPAAPWRWLQQAVALLRAQPRVLGGATALLLSVALVPSLVQVALSAAAPQFAQLLAVLLSLLLYPPAVAGFYRVVHALAQGTPVLPSALFAAFGDAPALRRMVIANLLFVSGSLLVVSALVWLLGGEALLQFLREVAALQPGAKQLPAPPPGVLPLVVALLLFGAALVSAQGLAFAELALGARAPLAAIAAALRLTARNFGALLLFYVPVAVLGFLAFMLVALVAVLLGTLLSVLSPSLAPLLVLLLSLVLMLAMYALLFSFFYFAWRELFADTPPPPPSAVHQIAA
jgi:hypothetical protein